MSKNWLRKFALPGILASVMAIGTGAATAAETFSSPNQSVLHSNIMDASGNLYDVVSEYIDPTGGGPPPSEDDIDVFYFKLDPVALSLGSIDTQQSIANFNRTTIERIHFFLGSGQTSGTGYLGQAPCEPCGSSADARKFWFQGQGGLINQEDQDGINGRYTNTYGYALGADRKISRQTVVGFGFGNSFFDTTMNHALGSASTKTYLLSVYGGHKVGAWQLSGAVGYVRSDLSSYRVVEEIGGWAKSDRAADTFYTSVEAARRFGSERRYLTPFLGYDFVGYREQGYSESGSLIDMTVGKQKVETAVQTLGARLGSSYVNRRGSVINPGMTLGWLHDYGRGAAITHAGFNQTNGGAMVLQGVSRHRDRMLIGVNMNAAVSKSLSVFGRYDGELADRYNSQTFQAGASWQF